MFEIPEGEEETMKQAMLPWNLTNNLVSFWQNREEIISKQQQEAREFSFSEV